MINKDRTGIRELHKIMIGLFGISENTTAKMLDVLKTRGELQSVHTSYYNMDSQIRNQLKQLMYALEDEGADDESTDDEESMSSDRDRDTFRPKGEPSGVDGSMGRDTFQPKGRDMSEGTFKQTFKDYLKEVTISVDSNDPDARMRFNASLRRAQSSDAGEKTVARQNVQDRVNARREIPKEAPDAALRQRMAKRREMAAREERKQVMTGQQE